MASEVDICNLALSHLGERAVITSINPPDQSKYAADAGQFYTLARDATLEFFVWDFATVRVQLAAVTNDVQSWQYAYQLPSDCLKPREVFEVGSADDHADFPFLVENRTLYTNVEDAVLRYTRKVTDTGLFSPGFVSACSVLLASYMAGPVTKSQKVANELFARFTAMGRMAAASNANNSNFSKYQGAPWIRNRLR